MIRISILMCSSFIRVIEVVRRMVSKACIDMSVHFLANTNSSISMRSLPQHSLPQYQELRYPRKHREMKHCIIGKTKCFATSDTSLLVILYDFDFSCRSSNSKHHSTRIHNIPSNTGKQISYMAGNKGLWVGLYHPPKDGSDEWLENLYSNKNE
jgi:hypothetical protein